MLTDKEQKWLERRQESVSSFGNFFCIHCKYLVDCDHPYCGRSYLCPVLNHTEEQIKRAKEFDRRAKKKRKGWDAEDAPCAHGMKLSCTGRRIGAPFLGCGDWCLRREALLEVEAEMEKE